MVTVILPYDGTRTGGPCLLRPPRAGDGILLSAALWLFDPSKVQLLHWFGSTKTASGRRVASDGLGNLYAGVDCDVGFRAVGERPPDKSRSEWDR